jgi:transposase
MPNYLKMPKKAQVLALLELGWSYRRIQAETGVRRETVSGYDEARQANAAKTFPGSDPSPPPDSLEVPLDAGPNAAKTFAGSVSKPAKTFPGSRPRRRFAAALYRTAITEKLDAGLSLQRIWQDLVEEYGYGASYESVKRFVRTITPTRRAVGVFHCAPGAEAQVDFFGGAPTLDAATGEWRRPWVFRMTLGHSRHGYEEAVWDQKLETFLRLHERAFRDLGGVPQVIRHDNLKAAVVRACFFDPDSHDVYLAFAAHWGFTPLPTRPRNPKENGKQERSGGYVKTNALKGRRFDSLDAQNAFLRHWNRTIARLRIHGTTRRQVWTHFVEVEQRALQPLPARRFRTSPAASARSTPMGTSKSPVRSTRCRSRCSASASASGGMRTSCASSTATRSLWSIPGWRRACLRPARARPRPPRASKRMSIDSSVNVSASGRRSSTGPTRRWPRAGSAPFASFKASWA